MIDKAKQYCRNDGLLPCEKAKFRNFVACVQFIWSFEYGIWRHTATHQHTEYFVTKIEEMHYINPISPIVNDKFIFLLRELYTHL